MRRRFPTLLIAFFAWLSGCSAIAVSVEHDPAAVFTGLSTWDWAEPGPPPGTDDILDARVRAAVERELTRRGFARDADGPPDFLVVYAAAVETSLQTVTIDRYSGSTSSAYLRQSGTSRDRPRSTMGQQKVVQEQEQGSLMLDVLQPEPRRVIWRAHARAVIEPGESQSRRDARLDDAVRKMLAGFPPN